MTNPTENTHVRYQLEGIDDSGKQQKARTLGRKNEKLGGPKHPIVRLQDYGRTSNPPKGCQGVVCMLNGNPDQSYVMNMEHPDHRPTGLGSGEWKDYDQWGHFLHAKQNGWQFKIGGSTIDIGADGVVTITATTINLVGNVHLGTSGGVPAAKLGSLDNDDEMSGADALVSNLATKVWVT